MLMFWSFMAIEITILPESATLSLALCPFLAKLEMRIGGRQQRTGGLSPPEMGSWWSSLSDQAWQSKKGPWLQRKHPELHQPVYLSAHETTTWLTFSTCAFALSMTSCNRGQSFRWGWRFSFSSIFQKYISMHRIPERSNPGSGGGCGK